MTREPLFEGPCAYAVKAKSGYEVIIYSTNCVEHVSAGITPNLELAEIRCRRANAYPAQWRKFYKLL